MARKTPEIHPAQGTLVSVSLMPEHEVPQLTAVEHLPQAVLEQHYEPRPEPTVTYGKPSTYVDVGKRANMLHQSLVAMGEANRRSGFDVASNAPQYAGPIYERYTWNTEKVKQGARRRGQEYIDTARHTFWKATGYTALRGTGLMTDEEIDARGRKEWRSFVRSYSHPRDRKDRDRYKRQLDRTKKRFNTDGGVGQRAA